MCEPWRVLSLTISLSGCTSVCGGAAELCGPRGLEAPSLFGACLQFSNDAACSCPDGRGGRVMEVRDPVRAECRQTCECAIVPDAEHGPRELPCHCAVGPNGIARLVEDGYGPCEGCSNEPHPLTSPYTTGRPAPTVECGTLGLRCGTLIDDGAGRRLDCGACGVESTTLPGRFEQVATGDALDDGTPLTVFRSSPYQASCT